MSNWDVFEYRRRACSLIICFNDVLKNNTHYTLTDLEDLVDEVIYV